MKRNPNLFPAADVELIEVAEKKDRLPEVLEVLSFEQADDRVQTVHYWAGIAAVLCGVLVCFGLLHYHTAPGSFIAYSLKFLEGDHWWIRKRFSTEAISVIVSWIQSAWLMGISVVAASTLYLSLMYSFSRISNKPFALTPAYADFLLLRDCHQCCQRISALRRCSVPLDHAIEIASTHVDTRPLRRFCASLCTAMALSVEPPVAAASLKSGTGPIEAIRQQVEMRPDGDMGELARMLERRCRLHPPRPWAMLLIFLLAYGLLLFMCHSVFVSMFGGLV